MLQVEDPLNKQLLVAAAVGTRPADRDRVNALVSAGRVPFQSLTWPLKNDGWKTTFLLGRQLFSAILNFGKVNQWVEDVVFLIACGNRKKSS